MKRTKAIILIISLLTILIFGSGISAKTDDSTEFNPGFTDQEILNGGNIIQDGHDTYYSEDEGIYVTSGDEEQLISEDTAENMNILNDTLYYTVSEGESSKIKTMKLDSFETDEIFDIDEEINQMYLVNEDEICYLADGNIYSLSIETGDSAQIETNNEVFSFLPTEYGIVYATGELFDLDIYAGETLISQGVSSYYTEQGNVLVNTDGQQYQTDLQDAFQGSVNLHEADIYETVELSEILCEDEDCEICEQNYQAFLNGSISLSSYQADEVSSTEEGYLQTLSTGQENVVLRARQQAEVEWTPLKTVSGWRGQYTFTAGTTYHGIPYGQPVDTGHYVPWTASISDFANAVKNSSSLFYTSSSSYGSRTSTYYASDCSSFVSWAWQLSSRQTTSTLIYRGTVYSSWTTYDFQVGDILNQAGNHTVLISKIEYDSTGAVSAVEIMEQTPPIIKTTRYGSGGTQTLATLKSKYSAFSLIRNNNINSVTYTPDDNVPLNNDQDGQFNDVSSSKWYYEAVQYVYENGLFDGTTSNTFEPEATMTRGQLVTVLGRMYNYDTSSYSYKGTITANPNVNFRSSPYSGISTNKLSVLTNGETVTVIGSVTGSATDDGNTTWYQVVYNGTTGYVHSKYVAAGSGAYSDVKANAYYAAYIEWAAKAGIVDGYSTTKFGPDDKLTREQMCTILCRYANYCNVQLQSTVAEVTFNDASSISGYAKEYVKALQKAGIIEGDNGNFNPDQSSQRAQVAAMLMRYHQIYG